MMCFAQFIGDKSPFDIIVAIVAFSTALYTFYKSFLERARLSLFPGDRVGLVLSTNGGCRKLHVRGSLVNHAVKTGTLHRLEARLTTPSGTSHQYEWQLFFSYVPGTLNVQASSNPIPVSVPGKNSQLLLAEFELTPSATTPAWSTGHYDMHITGWVNKANRSQPPNLNAVIHFSLAAAQAQQLSSQALGQSTVIDVPIEEWA
ncbi:MAG: hypothetical protein R3B74_10265 [Nitrospirales bacterium]|nr:hypothetical protein [Nitrospirales bacterium]